jgi:hypothetical protein
MSAIEQDSTIVNRCICCIEPNSSDWSRAWVGELEKIGGRRSMSSNDNSGTRELLTIGERDCRSVYRVNGCTAAKSIAGEPRCDFIGQSAHTFGGNGTVADGEHAENDFKSSGGNLEIGIKLNASEQRLKEALNEKWREAEPLQFGTSRCVWSAQEIGDRASAHRCGQSKQPQLVGD